MPGVCVLPSQEIGWKSTLFLHYVLAVSDLVEGNKERWRNL